MTKLETRMYNVLRTNPIPVTSGKYLAAIKRLIKKGLARKTTRGYEPAITI